MDPSQHPMQSCIDACLNCYRTCLQTAMNHCLERDGHRQEMQHFRLMMNCAEVCRAAADLMLAEVPAHRALCAACADLCDACADGCQHLGEMDECVAACSECAASCRLMTAMPAGADWHANAGSSAHH